MAEPEAIFHWRKDRFIALKGQTNILNNTLRETLKLRRNLPERQVVQLKEFDAVFAEIMKTQNPEAITLLLEYKRANYSE